MFRIRPAVQWLSFLLLTLTLVSSSGAAPTAWTTIGSGSSTAVAVTRSPIPGKPNVIFASFGGDNVTPSAIRRSEDRGATWTEVRSARAHSLATTPLSPGRVFAATDNGLVVSADYGASWTLLTPAVRTFVAVNTGNDNILYGDNLRSLDGGTTWAPMPGLPAIGTVGKDFHLKTTSSDPSLLVAFNGSAYISRNAGDNWTALLGQRSDEYSVGLDPVDGRFYYVGYCNNLQRWYAGGTELMGGGLSGDLHAIEADPVAHEKVFVSGQYGVFYYSGDHGDSWQAGTSTGEITYSGRMLVDGDEGRLYLPTVSGIRVLSTATIPSTPRVSASFVTGIHNGVTFVARNHFMPGEEVLLRARFFSPGSGFPLANASAAIRVAGPTTDNLFTGPSGEDGYSLIGWYPAYATPYKYTATLAGVAPPAGISWDGLVSSKVFTEGPACRFSPPVVGKYIGGTFVQAASFSAGEPVVFRIQVTDPNTGNPVPGAVVQFSVVYGVAVGVGGGQGTTGSDGWAEATWYPPKAETFRVGFTGLVPPAGHVWDGAGSTQSAFTVAAATTPTLRITGLYTGKYVKSGKTVTFVESTVFKAGEAVMIEGYLTDMSTGELVACDKVGGTVIDSAGAVVTTFTAAAAGTGFEAKWQTKAATRRVPGTPPGPYTIRIDYVAPPAGYVWNGTIAGISIIVQ